MSVRLCKNCDHKKSEHFCGTGPCEHGSLGILCMFTELLGIACECMRFEED